MKEPGLIYRCLGILLESIAMNSDPATSGDRFEDRIPPLPNWE
jgi:hypothetical protein